MRRFTAIILLMLLIQPAALSGCTRNTSNNEGKINVICTIFPQYDWVRQILGDKANGVNLTLLLNNRIDLHNFQPSVDDIVKISTCDLFIYVGGESDKWVDDALKQATNKNMVVINLLETLGEFAKTEEIIDGMEADDHGLDEDDEYHEEDYDKHEEDYDKHEDDDDHDHDKDAEDRETDYDEHIWLSLRNAQVFCAVIAGALTSLDSGNAETYQRNLTVYTDKLSVLDSAYQAAVSAPSTSAPAVRTLLFGDRFPFRYLVDDYGLDYYAAFVGCSAETEASFDTIIFLAGKLDELGLKNVMVTESSDKKIAETIIREAKGSNQQILVLDAMQSVSKTDISNGATYLSIMESNLDVLKEALR